MAFFCTRKKSKDKRFPRGAIAGFAKDDTLISFFIIERQHSLQVQASEARHFTGRSRKGLSLFTSVLKLRGSFTVEAAVAMTVLLFAVMALLGFFFVLRTEIQVQTALEQTGNQLAGIPEGASLVSASLLFQEKLVINKADTSQIVGGSLGISLGKSTVMGRQPIIDLVADYQVKLPFFPDSFPGLRIIQRSRKQAFGEAKFLSSQAERYVYVTPSGEVYHESMYCTYIRPETEKLNYEEIGSRRNGNGEGYEECSFCESGEAVADSVVWITKWGDRYHLSEFCRGIWHDVKQISISAAEGRRVCSKCSTESESTKETEQVVD